MYNKQHVLFIKVVYIWLRVASAPTN